MASNAAETAIGAVVLLAAAGFLGYAAQSTDLGDIGGGDYALVAKFRKAEGLVVGGDVRVAGVKVGTITSIRLDPETYQAATVLVIDEEVKLPDDSDALIATEGLLGGAHVSITPGSSEFLLADGDEIQFTQGSINLLDLVGKAISSTAAE